MPPKDVERMANSVDSDQTALKELLRSSLIRIYTVCSDIHVPIFRIFKVYELQIVQIKILHLQLIKSEVISRFLNNIPPINTEIRKFNTTQLSTELTVFT